MVYNDVIVAAVVVFVVVTYLASRSAGVSCMSSSKTRRKVECGQSLRLSAGVRLSFLRRGVSLL